MSPNWRKPGVRASLTAWYVIAMVLVLAVYATAVFGFVSRSLSDALNERLRVEFQLAGAMVSQETDGALLWFEDDRNGGQYSRWLQGMPGLDRVLADAEATMKSLGVVRESAG